jgi:hypothetical protein
LDEFYETDDCSDYETDDEPENLLADIEIPSPHYGDEDEFLSVPDLYGDSQRASEVSGVDMAEVNAGDDISASEVSGVNMVEVNAGDDISASEVSGVE